jgi:hypothetical protein
MELYQNRALNEESMSGYAELLASQGRHEEAIRLFRPNADKSDMKKDYKLEAHDRGPGINADKMKVDVDTENHEESTDMRQRMQDEDGPKGAGAVSMNAHHRNNRRGMTLENLLENDEYIDYVDEYLNGGDDSDIRRTLQDPQTKELLAPVQKYLEKLMENPDIEDIKQLGDVLKDETEDGGDQSHREQTDTNMVSPQKERFLSCIQRFVTGVHKQARAVPYPTVRMRPEAGKGWREAVYGEVCERLLTAKRMN